MPTNFHIEGNQALMIVGPAKVTAVLGSAADTPFVTDLVAPTADSLTPNSAVAGDDADVQMFVNGSGFSEISKIVFNGNDEPTSFHDAGKLSTIVKPSIFAVAADVDVAVRNGTVQSDPVTFSFTEAVTRAAATKHKRDDDDDDDHKRKKR